MIVAMLMKHWILAILLLIYLAGMCWAFWITRGWGRNDDDPRSRTFAILLWPMMLLAEEIGIPE